jgi:hypothetical protein
MTTRDLDQLIAEQNAQYARYKREFADHERMKEDDDERLWEEDAKAQRLEVEETERYIRRNADRPVSSLHRSSHAGAGFPSDDRRMGRRGVRLPRHLAGLV